MVYSEYTKKRILYYHEKKYSHRHIVKALSEEGIRVSRSGVWGFLKHYKETGAIQRKQGSGRPSTLSREGKELIDETMRSSDETTKELRAVLRSCGHNASFVVVRNVCIYVLLILHMCKK